MNVTRIMKDGSWWRTNLFLLLAFVAGAAGSLRAATITGTVVDSTQTGVANAVIDVQDSGGNTVSIVNDTTDAQGNFSFGVPDNDSYDLFFTPPVAARLVAGVVSGVSVNTGTTNAGSIELEAGALVSGTVRRTADSSPVAGVNLNVLDDAGDVVFTPGDSTDPSGDFAVVTPLGSIELRILPARSERLVSRRDALAVAGDVSLGDLFLDPGALLSGQLVRQSNGLPVEGADTDVDLAADGSRILTPGDNSDENGLFAIVVPLTTVDLAIEPDKQGRLVGVEIPGIQVNGDTSVGVVSLESGALLSGRVLRSADSSPVADADLDVDLTSSGARVPTAGDNTDASGNFSVVVPLTLVDLIVEPRKADRVLATVRTAINVTGDVNLGDITVDPGVLLSGTVVRTTGGSPVVGADTDTADAYTGVSILTPGDDTDATGDFSVVVPEGTVELSIEPRVEDRLVAHRIVALDIVGDTDLGTISLGDGFLVSGSVTGLGIGVADVPAFAYDLATGERVPTPRSLSAANGTYSFVLPAGTFQVKWSPPLGSGFSRLLVDPFTVAGDTVFNPTLVPGDLSVTMGGIGHVIDAGSRYEPTVFLRNNSGGARAITAVITAEVPSFSVVRNVAPPIDKTIPGTSVILSGRVKLRIPGGLNNRFRGIPILVRTAILDPASQTLIDQDFIDFEVR